MTHDDYRFHDVFHLAYRSDSRLVPVLRALFKVKRKSHPKLMKPGWGAGHLDRRRHFHSGVSSCATLNHFRVDNLARLLIAEADS
jgi:hypothetical protein